MSRKKVIIGVILVFVAVGIFLQVIVSRAKADRAAFCTAVFLGNTNEVARLLTGHPSLANIRNLQNYGPFANGAKKSLDGWTPLHFAASMGNSGMIELLARFHADLNAHDARGLTPLLWTTFGGKLDTASTLIANGADVNARGLDGRSALDLAKLSKDTAMIAFLQEHGAK